MPDPIFAAEMRAIAADRIAARRLITGDGMAVEAPSFMNFDGPRVTPPRPKEPWFDVTAYRSIAHRHAMNDDCLEPVAEAPYPTARGEEMVKQAGWFRCSVAHVYVHQHDDVVIAHTVRDRSCPVPLG